MKLAQIQDINKILVHLMRGREIQKNCPPTPGFDSSNSTRTDEKSAQLYRHTLYSKQGRHGFA